MNNFLFNFLANKKHSDLGKLPGPKPVFPIGNFIDFIRMKPWELVDSYHLKYGKVFAAWAGPIPMVFVFDYLGAKEIFIDKMSEYTKGMPTKSLFPSLGRNAPFVCNGTDWEVARKLNFLSSPLMKQFLEKEFHFLRDKVPHLIKKHKLNESIGSFEKKTFDLMADYMSLLILGKELPREILNAFKKQSHYADLSIKFNFPIITPTFLFNRGEWLNFWESQLLSKHETGLISYFLKGSSLDRKNFARELSNIFWGGIFSTTSTLVSSLFHLSKNETNLNCLREELPKDIKDYYELSEKKVLEGVIRETLRINPAIPIFGRTVIAPETDLMGMKLKKGTMVIFSCRPYHFDSDHWNSPYEFKPERWSKKVIEENDFGSEHFMPFGLGSRACAGQEMAVYLLKSLLYGIIKEGKPLFKNDKQEFSFFFGCQVQKNMKGEIKLYE